MKLYVANVGRSQTLLQKFIKDVFRILLPHFRLVVSFYTFWKHQLRSVFLCFRMFSGSIQRDKWHEMGQTSMQELFLEICNYKKLLNSSTQKKLSYILNSVLNKPVSWGYLFWKIYGWLTISLTISPVRSTAFN